MILRGLSLVIRASFSPNEPAAQAKHFMSIQSDIGPWLKDYATEIEKPAVDFWFSKPGEIGDGHGGAQQ